VLLAQQIADNYYSYDGFVILHGTDTMAYTASALSFMLENLGKAVVLTGSMIPLEEPVSDAKRNLLISMMVAAHLNITEVLLFFNTHLLRGNRAKKTDPWRLAAIESVNTEPLATMGVGIHMRTKLLLHPPGRRFNCHTQLYHNIIVLTMTPAFCYDSLKAMASSWRGIPGCEPPALVLLMFGSGNAPINVRAFQEAIDLCLSEKCPVVIMSQCVHGSVDLTQYEGGMRLAKMGVIDGKDMTVEACTTKLSYLLGRGLRGSMLKKAMETNLRGELEIKPTVSYTGFALGAQSYLAKL
jgi:L-asparaginase type I